MVGVDGCAAVPDAVMTGVSSVGASSLGDVMGLPGESTSTVVVGETLRFVGIVVVDGLVVAVGSGARVSTVICVGTSGAADVGFASVTAPKPAPSAVPAAATILQLIRVDFMASFSILCAVSRPTGVGRDWGTSCCAGLRETPMS